MVSEAASPWVSAWVSDYKAIRGVFLFEARSKSSVRYIVPDNAQTHSQ